MSFVGCPYRVSNLSYIVYISARGIYLDSISSWELNWEFVAWDFWCIKQTFYNLVAKHISKPKEKNIKQFTHQTSFKTQEIKM
jgi:hypothetical protein